MFEKMLYGGKSLYFRYAPPLTDLDAISDDELPNAPYVGAPKHKRSVYFYWWAFLRENEDYMACCDAGGSGSMQQLYADFGDVRGDSFMDWWRAGGRLLFCEPPEEPITTYLSPPTDQISQDRVLLSVPVTGDLERTMAEMRKILREAFEYERRRRIREEGAVDAFSRANYPVFKKPVLTALHERLIVHQAKKENPNASLYEIGKMTGVAQRTAGVEGDAEHRNVVGASVSRSLKEAKALIYNVGSGRFPDTTPPPKVSTENMAKSA